MHPKPSVIPPPTRAAAYFRFVILLLPATATSTGVLEDGTWASAPASRPYMAVLGPLPLHFAAAAAPPDPLSEVMSTPAAVAKPEKESAEATSKTRDVLTPAAEPNSSVATAAKDLPDPKGAKESREPKIMNSPKPIIRDEFSAPVRPEDLLPFFAFPPGRREGGISAPGQIVPPPSSATYRQQ